MAFDPNNPYTNGPNVGPGSWRSLETGADLEWADPTQADGANDDPGTPALPIVTNIDGPWGLPWFDAVEDTDKRVDYLAVSPNPLPWSPQEDIGNVAMHADYTAAYRTRGPIVAFGHEPSGGLYGDQAIGRIMRFPANIPDRFDPYGVFNTDIRDDLAAGMMVDDMEVSNTADITTNLLQWPNVWGRW